MYQKEGPDSMSNPEVGKTKRHLLRWGVSLRRGPLGRMYFKYTNADAE